MLFADPSLCPDCRGSIVGAGPRCPRCGIDLQDPDLQELWTTLVRADDLLARAVARRDTLAPASWVPSDPFSSVVPDYPAPAPPRPSGPETPRTGPSWSVGTVLLGLGAVGLVVAAIIFVSRSWDSIGLAGKAAVLAAATATAVAAATWVTRRPLRASAEALWAVALALLALDLVGARAEGLLGLDAVPWAWVLAVSGVAVVAAAAGALLLARPHLGTDLVVAAVGTTAGTALAAGGASQVADVPAFWQQLVALLVTGALGLALRATGSRLVALGARVLLALAYLGAAVLAVAEALDHPEASELVGGLHGLPLLLTSLAALAVAAAIAVVRVPMTALAVVGLGLLVVVPSAESGDLDGAVVAVSALSVVVALAGLRGTGPWTDGVRWSIVPGATFLVGLAAWWLGDAIAVAVTALDQADGAALTDRSDSSLGALAVAAAMVGAAGLVTVAVAVPRWSGARLGSGAHATLVLAVASVSVVAVLLAARAPWWAVVAAEVAATLAALEVVRRTASVGLLPVAVASALLALSTAVVSQPLFAATWIVLGAAAAAVAVLAGPAPARRAAAVLSTPLVVGGLAAGVDAAGAPRTATVLTALVVAAVALAAASRSPQVPRIGFEVGAGLALLVAAVSADSTSVAAVCWTVVGVVLSGVAMTTADRRWYGWPGIAAFVIAYVLLVVDSGFGFVEAYTLPLAALALAAGAVLLRRRPTTSTWVALGPGLALGLLPSVPQALAEPAGLRALLLGLASVVVLAVGVRLGQQAPFLLGSSVALLVVLFNIGPYANAAPRVLVISAVSLVLVGLGITWEDRVRDGRRIMAFVKEMT